jgi:putative transposase
VVHFERNVLSTCRPPPCPRPQRTSKRSSRSGDRRRPQGVGRGVRLALREGLSNAVSGFEAGIWDALTYLSYPGSHHAKTHSTNMLERLFKEVKRRSRGVRAFPSETSASTLMTEIALRARFKTSLLGTGISAAIRSWSLTMRRCLTNATTRGVSDRF